MDIWMTLKKAVEFYPDKTAVIDGERSFTYAQALKSQVTIRLDKPTIEYFKKLSEEVGVPYQSLINLYLRDCAISEKKLELKWAS